jgi:hypothetical protein
MRQEEWPARREREAEAVLETMETSAVDTLWVSPRAAVLEPGPAAR